MITNKTLPHPLILNIRGGGILSVHKRIQYVKAPRYYLGGIAIFQDEPAGSSGQSRQPSASGSSRSRQHVAAAAVGQENAAPRTATSGVPSIPSRADHKGS